MLVLKIIINNTTYKLLNDLVISNYFLINIFDEGICITQNLSSSSNISVFIDKKYLDLHQVLQEKSLVCEVRCIANMVSIAPHRYPRAFAVFSHPA